MKEVWRTSSKIMVVVMLCASLLSASIGGVVLYQSSRFVEQNTYKNLTVTAENYANVFSKSTEKVEATLAAYLSSIYGTLDFSTLFSDPDRYLSTYQEQTLVPLTRQYAVDNKKNFLGIYFDFNPDIPANLLEGQQTYGTWFLDKNLSGQILRNDMELKKNFDPKNEEMRWYYDAVNAGTGIWSEPYTDIYTGLYMISYTAPLYYKNQLIGVAGIDMTFDSVTNIIKQFKVFDTGYAFLLSSDYDIIVSPKEKGVIANMKLTDADQDYQKLINAIEAGMPKHVMIGKSSDENVLSYGKMSNGYIFVIEVKSSEILEDLNYIRMLIDTLILFGIILCAVVAYFLGKYIAKPVEEAQKRIHKLSCMDLQESSHSVKIYKNNDGQRMIDEIDSIRQNLEKLITGLKRNFNQEEILQENHKIVIEKMEIILERIQQNHETVSDNQSLTEFQIQESQKLLTQLKHQLLDLMAIHDQNKKLGGAYYLDENSNHSECRKKAEREE